MREKCGIVGIYGAGLPVSRLAFFALFALQHRGQEASGITTSDGNKLHTHKGAGLVAQVYKEKDIEKLKGYIGLVITDILPLAEGLSIMLILF